LTTASFVATAPFIADHPPALAFYCSDGRFTEPVEELLRHLGHPRLDTLTLPGGGGLLNPTSASFADLDAARRAAQFLIEAHAIRDAFLIAHAGCGYYRRRMATTKTAEQIVAAQRKDLQVAAETLRRANAALRTHLFFARIDGARVAFDPVS
jgi:hypothetical protein